MLSRRRVRVSEENVHVSEERVSEENVRISEEIVRVSEENQGWLCSGGDLIPITHLIMKIFVLVFRCHNGEKSLELIADTTPVG